MQHSGAPKIRFPWLDLTGWLLEAFLQAWFPVVLSRLQMAWLSSRGWTTSTETWGLLTSWWETIWSARSLTLAWLDWLKTMNTLLDKVCGWKCDINTFYNSAWSDNYTISWSWFFLIADIWNITIIMHFKFQSRIAIWLREFYMNV